MSITREMIFVFIGFLFGLIINNVSVEGLAVNWGTIASHPLPPEVVVKLLQDDGFNKVKLFDNNPGILKALAGSGIEVMIAVTNLQLKVMADPANAKAWVKANVTSLKVKSRAGVKITHVCVGNEPFLKDYKDMFVNVTYPALKNIQDALNAAGIGDVVKAIVPFNADVYDSPTYNPVPSAGYFRPDVVDTVKDILAEMDKNNAPFMVNIYPFLSAFYGGNQFPLDFAFFDDKGSPLVDGSIKYMNVFDAMVDTLASALKGAGYKDMEIIVGEIGWPTNGNILANVSMAERFYSGIVPKVLANQGTPLRPGHMDVYFFALFDEDEKSTLPGTFERSWGIYSYDGRPKFPLAITKDNKTLASADVKYLKKQWCVLKSGAAANNATAIGAATSYACDRTDCTPTAPGSSCSGVPTNLQTSFIFNSFYQDQNQSVDACAFNGLATITTKDPSSGTCNFTIGIVVNTGSASAPALSPSTSKNGTSSGGKSGGGGGKSPSADGKSGAEAAVPALAVVVLAIIIGLVRQI